MNIVECAKGKQHNEKYNIEFVIGRIMMMIILLTTPITKKSTYYKTRGQFIMFYLWMKKNKIEPKPFKEE